MPLSKSIERLDVLLRLGTFGQGWVYTEKCMYVCNISIYTYVHTYIHAPGHGEMLTVRPFTPQPSALGKLGSNTKHAFKGHPKPQNHPEPEAHYPKELGPADSERATLSDHRGAFGFLSSQEVPR